MKSLKRFILFVAIICLIAGGICLALAIKNNDFKAKNMVDRTYEIDGEFQNISAFINTDDFEFKLSEDGKNKLVCREFENQEHEVKVEENALRISDNDTRKWYDRIFVFNFESPKSVLYLTKDNYNNIVLNGATGKIAIDNTFTFENAELVVSTGMIEFGANVTNNLNVKVSTGYAKIMDVNCNDAYFKTSTGKLDVINMNCEKFTAEGSTGQIVLTNVISNTSMDVKASTGDVFLNEVDAETIYVKVSTGSIRGVILTPKTFKTEASTGHVDVPRDTTGGDCTLIVSTGNISVKVK